MENLTFIRTLSFIIATLIVLTSWLGLVSPDTYANETEYWATQAMGQDLINICILPFYLFFAFIMSKKKDSLVLIWTGITAYFIYTFFIYCFDIHFNQLFLFYILILGLSIYSLVFVLYTNRKNFYVYKKDSFLSLFAGGYFIVIAVFFYMIWLSEILPANLFDTIPDNLDDLPTNPVHVLDLAIVLPGIIIGGILLIRNNKLGYILAPIILTFSLIMELSIGILMLYLWNQNEGDHPELSLLLFSLASIDLALLVTMIRSNRVSQ